LGSFDSLKCWLTDGLLDILVNKNIGQVMAIKEGCFLGLKCPEK
jgi:hypothetical protein